MKEQAPGFRKDLEGLCVWVRENKGKPSRSEKKATRFWVACMILFRFFVGIRWRRRCVGDRLYGVLTR